MYSVSTVFRLEKLWTQNTRIIHDVWRLLILSNEEKTNDYEKFEKEWFIWKFWKRGGVVEKRGEEETKSMPHAPVVLWANFCSFFLFFFNNLCVVSVCNESSFSIFFNLWVRDSYFMARPSSDLIIVSVLLQRISVSSLKQSFSISLLEELFEDSNGKSESVNRRWTDNTMTQKKKDKRRDNALQNTT